MDNPPRKVGKPLRKPLAPLFAAHRGECRVVYRIIDQRLVIEVVSGGHRRDVPLLKASAFLKISRFFAAACPDTAVLAA